MILLWAGTCKKTTYFGPVLWFLVSTKLWNNYFLLLFIVRTVWFMGFLFELFLHRWNSSGNWHLKNLPIGCKTWFNLVQSEKEKFSFVFWNQNEVMYFEHHVIPASYALLKTKPHTNVRSKKAIVKYGLKNWHLFNWTVI